MVHNGSQCHHNNKSCISRNLLPLLSVISQNCSIGRLEFAKPFKRIQERQVKYSSKTGHGKIATSASPVQLIRVGRSSVPTRCEAAWQDEVTGVDGKTRHIMVTRL
eukprot:scpid70272/ scgid25554/ 